MLEAVSEGELDIILSQADAARKPKATHLTVFLDPDLVENMVRQIREQAQIIKAQDRKMAELENRLDHYEEE